MSERSVGRALFSEAGKTHPIVVEVVDHLCEFIRITPWPVFRLQMGEMGPRRVPLRVISRGPAASFGVNCKADINVWVRNGRDVAFRTECTVMMNLSARFIS